MYNPNVPSSNMGIAPVSSAPSQPLGPTPMVAPQPMMGMAPMGPPPPMAPPMMGGMPPPPMMGAPMGPPPIAPITEGLGGFGGSRAGRAGFSERMQQMTAPPKPRPMPQPIQGMQYGGSVSSQGLSMYQPPMNGGMHRMPDGSMMPNNDPSMGGMPMQQPMMPRPMGMMDGGIVPNRVEPLKMALGGFIGNSSTRDYGGDRYTDPYEELARDYGYDPTDPYGDNGTAGDDSGGEDDYGYLDDDYVYVPPTIAEDLVVVPPPEESGGDSEQRIIQEIFKQSADPTIGPNNAQEAMEQALADNKAGNIDLADSSLATLAGRISRGRDSMPARLGSIDAISQDFAVPEAADTTFSDPEIFDLSNPISLNAAQVVGPNSRTDASGNLVPRRADTAADIEAGTEAALNLGPEVMSSSPASSGDMRDVNLGLSPVISGMSDSPIIDTNFPPSGTNFSLFADPADQNYNPPALPSMGTAPKMALPGDIPTQSTQSFNIPNRVDAGRAALDSLRAKEKRGITSLSNIAEKNEELRKELEILQGRAGERFANNIDEATSFYKPEGTGMDAFNQMLSDPANYEINRVGRLSPEKLAQSPFTKSEAKYVFPPTGDPITDAELSEARDIYGDFDPTLDDPYVAGTALPGGSAIPNDIQLEVAQPTGGGITYVPEGGPDYTARRAGEILENLKTAPRTTAASEAARSMMAGMSDAPLGGDDALINPLPYTEYGLSRSSGVDAEARRLSQGILAGDNQLNEGGMYPKALSNLDNASKTAAFATQGMTPGTPEYLSTLIETADAASRAGDIPSQVLPSTGLTSDPNDPNAGYNPLVGEDIQNPPRTLRQATGRAPMTSEEAAMNVSGIDSAGNVVSLAGASGYDSPAAAANRATDLAQPVPAGTDGGDTEVDDVDIFGGNFNRNQFTDRESYKNREDLYSLFGPSKGAEIFNSAVKSLSMGLIDLDKLSAKQREKALNAYNETGKLAYNKNGKLIGVEDPDGRAILLGPQPPKDEDNIGGDDDGCPPGFRRVNGVCMPIRRVARNPATAISDSIEKSTLPSTLRPIVRDVVDDEDDEEETSDVGGLTIRRPSYFANGGAVSDGMGSAIDNFLSSMGGGVKKKSDVAPVGMANGGYVTARSGFDGSEIKGLKTRVDRNSRGPASADYYGDSYGDNSSDSYNNEYNFHSTDPAAAPVFPDVSSSGFFDPEPEPVGLTRSLRPQLRPASFLNESFGDRRQRLAGGPNVFDGAGPSYDVAGLKIVNDAGYDPYVSNAISSVQDYFNDGSVEPTMQNAATLSIPTPSPMPIAVIPSLSNQTLEERGYSPIQHSQLYEEEFGYTPEESIFNDFSLNLQQNQLTEDEIEQMRIRASNRARKGILSDPYTTQGLGVDYAEPKLSPGLYVDPETGKRSTTMSYRDQASKDEAMNALRLIGGTDAQKDGDANTNELRAIAARKLVDMGVPNSLLGVATGYLDATPYGAGTALFDAYDSSKDTVGSLAEGDLKGAGRNAAITGLNLLGGVPGALQAGSLARSGIRAGTNKADDFFRQQFYNFQAQRDAMADVVPSTLAPYRSQNVISTNVNSKVLRRNRAKDAINIRAAQAAYANGVPEQAILNNYGVSVYRQTDVNGQVERVRFAHAEPINSVNDVDLSKVTEAGVPISQAIKNPNNSPASVPPNRIQGMNTLRLAELTDDDIVYGVGGSATKNPTGPGGYITVGRQRDPLSGILRPLTQGYKPLLLHEVEHIKQYDSFANTSDFGPRGGPSGYYDFKKRKLNQINKQLKDSSLTANNRADLIATRDAFKNMSASEMYNNSVKELKAKGAELGKFDSASGSGPMAVKTLSPLEIINPYEKIRGLNTLTERLNAALGSKLPSQNTAISISNTLENTAIALRKKGFSNQRIDEIIGNLSRKLKEESIQNSVEKTMQAKIRDENTMGDIFDARRTVDLPAYNRPLNESIK